MQLETEYKTSEEGKKKKKKNKKNKSILEKTKSEAFERTISEPCAAEISGKKKQNHEGRLWQSSS